MNIRAMTAADISFAMQLKAQNHWNQLESDWRRQLDLEPTGCFVAVSGSQPVGTACACVFGDVAWINMVLVDRSQRGQGIGTALMRHVVQYLDESGVQSIRLDATPLGQPVYEKLGFRGDFTLERQEGILSGGDGGAHVGPLTSEDLPAVFAMDESVTQTRREKLLQPLYDAHPAMMRKYVVDDRLEGYCLCRPGANAWQLGPLQGSSAAGVQLLFDAAQRFPGERVYLDVPTGNATAVKLVQSLGLQVQRSFLRMTRGRRVQENLGLFWTSFGPEKG